MAAFQQAKTEPQIVIERANEPVTGAPPLLKNSEGLESLTSPGRKFAELQRINGHYVSQKAEAEPEVAQPLTKQEELRKKSRDTLIELGNEADQFEKMKLSLDDKKAVVQIGKNIAKTYQELWDGLKALKQEDGTALLTDREIKQEIFKLQQELSKRKPGEPHTLDQLGNARFFNSQTISVKAAQGFASRSPEDAPALHVALEALEAHLGGGGKAAVDKVLEAHPKERERAAGLYRTLFRQDISKPIAFD